MSNFSSNFERLVSQGSTKVNLGVVQSHRLGVVHECNTHLKPDCQALQHATIITEIT